MQRRNFLTGLLCAPVLIRASSLDALPRGKVISNLHPDYLQIFYAESVRCVGVDSYVLTGLRLKPGDLVVLTSSPRPSMILLS